MAVSEKWILQGAKSDNERTSQENSLQRHHRIPDRHGLMKPFIGLTNTATCCSTCFQEARIDLRLLRELRVEKKSETFEVKHHLLNPYVSNDLKREEV